MGSEIEVRADFSKIRYAQCWEDADILLEAMNIKKDDTIVSIASAGDNSFAMLVNQPKKVIAIDLSIPQIACCEIRKACYKYLSYSEFMLFNGTLNMGTEEERIEIYNKIADNLPTWVKDYFDGNLEYIKNGFMTVGKFENYFKIFREKVLPLVHNKKRIDMLFEDKSIKEQEEFYNKIWGNFRWNFMFRIFFSKAVMGKLGRDPEFYKYVTTSAADRIQARTKYALINIKNHTNPYLNFILRGSYNESALPFALRKENFEKIKENIDKIEFRKTSLEDVLLDDELKVDAFNLSDIFEYMSEESMSIIYEKILEKSSKNARIVYWNMLVDRKCPDKFKDKVSRNEERCKELLNKDKAFFYSDFVIEEIF